MTGPRALSDAHGYALDVPAAAALSSIMSYLRVILPWALILLATTPLAAQSRPGDAIAWSARPAIVAYRDRQLTWDDEARLSLLASGTDEARIPQFVAQLRKLASEARSVTRGMSPAESADRLLQFLHERTFSTYNFYQTRIDTLLQTGTFNCVSSAVVYNLLAQSIGLKTGAVKTPDHAFSTVLIGDRSVDVETTTALGFDPGRKREFHDAFGKLTGFAYVPQNNYAGRTPIDFRGLVGLILQNRMTEDQMKGDQSSPVALAWNIWGLQGTPEARRLLIQAYSNYLAGLNNRGEYTAGLEILGRLESTIGRDSRIDTLIAAFAQNVIVARIAARDFSGAGDAIDRWGDRTNRPVHEWKVTLLNAEATSKYSASGWKSTISWVSGQTGFSGQEIDTVVTRLTLLELQKRIGGNNWDSAYAFWMSLPDAIRTRPEVQKIGSVLGYNLSVSYHNRFAALMNQGKTSEGRLVLEEGLKRFPESSILLEDARRLAQRSGQ